MFVSDLMEEHIDSGSRCLGDHPLVLVAEGYAYCSDGMEAASPVSWWPWRLTPPSPELGHSWTNDLIRGRDGRPLTAWIGEEAHSLAAVLAFIQEDIEAHRQLPFDEDRERARLMPV
jgi:hypothetical protein